MGVLAKIGADIKRSDIVIAHRVGRFQQGRYQPIIVRFTSKIHKNKVIYQHCKLKGIGIDISNDLTTKNMAYLKNSKLTREYQLPGQNTQSVLLNSNTMTKFFERNRLFF